MKSTRFYPVLSLLVFSCFCFSGCSTNTLDTTKVSGSVTLDGQPIAGVEVAFIPLSPDGREAYGTTDEKGVFTLTTPGANVDSGIIPGEYIATFTKFTSPADGLSGEEIQKKFPQGLPSAVNAIPQKYADKQSTDIQPVKIDKGVKKELEFKLSSQ